MKKRKNKEYKLTCKCVGDKHCDKLWIIDMGDDQFEINLLLLPKEFYFKSHKGRRKIGNRYLAGGVVVSKKELNKIINK